MTKSIQTVEQKTVLFYDDEIIAIRLQNGQIYVPVRPICELIGVQWSAQSKRIKRDPVLSEMAQNLSVSVTDTLRTKQRVMICLPLDYISGFLFGINATRVKEALQPKLIQYQKECYHVLSEAFQDGRLSLNPSFSELLQNDNSPSVQAYKMAQAIMQMAQQQIVLEARMSDHEQRIEQLEALVSDSQLYITAEQASQVSQAVKAIAMTLGKRTGRNEYGGVYGEMYRQFGITSYKLLPADKFTEAMTFLTEWHRTLVDDVPF